MSSIQYSRNGSGDPVVLVHGIGHTRLAWKPLAEMLAENHDVIAIDLPGHGESPSPLAPHGWSLTSHAEQLEELFDELGLDRPHVIGNSLGGGIVLELAARGRVRSATAISPAGFFSPVGTLWAGAVLNLLKLLSCSPKPVITLFGGRAFGRKLVMGALYAHPERVTPEDFLHHTLGLRRSRGYIAHVLRLPFYRFTRATVVPTTILWGDRDRVLLPTQAKVARRRLPQATHASLGHAGHCAQLDVPELVMEHAEAAFALAAGGQVQAGVARAT